MPLMAIIDASDPLVRLNGEPAIRGVFNRVRSRGMERVPIRALRGQAALALLTLLSSGQVDLVS